MNPFRIALFTGNYNHIRDGVSLTLNRLVNFLESKGVDVLIFGPTVENPELKHTGRLVPVPSISMPGRPEYRITTRFPRDAVRELEEFNPDIIHIATPDILGFQALRWGLRNNKEVVSSYHTHFTSYLKYYHMGFLTGAAWIYMRWFYSNCKQVYVPTESMLGFLRNNSINGDLRIWSRGVDTEIFHPGNRSEKWRSRHGFSEDDIIVTFVSRLVWEKNLTVYAESVLQAAKDNPRIKCMVVGEGPAGDDLRELLPQAHYTGFLEGRELAESYACSDVFLFPSDTETFGNVTLEAMASGLPCIVADAVGSRSLVEDRVNGFVIDLSHPDRFVSAVVKLSEDHELRRSMSRSSRNRAQAYAWENVNNQLLTYYQDLLAPAI